MVRALAAPLAGVLLSVALLAHTRGLDEVAQSGQLGPGFWPRLILIALGASSLAKLLGVARAGRSPRAAAVARDEISAPRLAASVAALVLYVVVTPLVGFAFATTGFVAAFMTLAGARSTGGIVATATLTTVTVLYVFVRIVYLPLPKGAGPLEDVTIAVYRVLRIF